MTADEIFDWMGNWVRIQETINNINFTSEVEVKKQVREISAKEEPKSPISKGLVAKPENRESSEQIGWGANSQEQKGTEGRENNNKREGWGSNGNRGGGKGRGKGKGEQTYNNGGRGQTTNSTGWREQEVAMADANWNGRQEMGWNSNWVPQWPVGGEQMWMQTPMESYNMGAMEASRGKGK